MEASDEDPRIEIKRWETVEATTSLSTEPGDDPHAALIAAAKHIYRRYAVEVVEALHLCPWAKVARLSGQVALDVVSDVEPDPVRIAARMEWLAAREQTVIALVIFPRLRLDPQSFRHLTAQVRRAADALWDVHCPWAVADFHPAGPVDLSSPERAVSLIRRSPDPTLQLVRLRVLHDLRAQAGEGSRFVDPETLDLDDLSSIQIQVPLHDRIAERNHERLLGLGADAVLARLAEIGAERRARYAQLGVASAPWDLTVAAPAAIPPAAASPASPDAHAGTPGGNDVGAGAYADPKRP